MMKRVMAIVLAAVLGVGMTVSAAAADSVTIQQPHDGMRDLYTIRGIQNTSTVTVGADYYGAGCLALQAGDTKTVYEVPAGQPVVLHAVQMIEISKAEIRDGKVYTDGSDTGIAGLFDDLTTSEEQIDEEYSIQVHSGPLNITTPGYYAIGAYISGSAQSPELHTVSSILHVVQAAQPEQPSAGTAFTDVSPTAYYADPVAWAVEEGITNGTSATLFSPEQTCTRAQIITFLWRAAGSPEPQQLDAFSDVNTSEYYAKAAAWAAENGMADGAAFSPNAPCTREMAVEFMWKHAGSPSAAAASFTDISSPAVDWAVANGVTNGTSATTFSPDQTCTRAQIVTFLYRAFAE